MVAAAFLIVDTDRVTKQVKKLALTVTVCEGSPCVVGGRPATGPSKARGTCAECAPHCRLVPSHCLEKAFAKQGETAWFILKTQMLRLK